MKEVINKQLQLYHQKLHQQHQEVCCQGKALSSGHGCEARCPHNCIGLCHHNPLLAVKDKYRQSLYFYSRYIG